MLSPRSHGLIGAADLARMKPGAILVNTSRGPIVDETALLEAVSARRIVAALDVFDREPLPADHPLRSAPNTVMTPHLGYGVQETWKEFYQQSLENALSFLDGMPVRVVNPEVIGRRLNSIHCAGTVAGAPAFFTKNTRILAGFVLLPFFETV